MYSKEFRRPTPPGNYSGTAFMSTADTRRVYDGSASSPINSSAPTSYPAASCRLSDSPETHMTYKARERPDPADTDGITQPHDTPEKAEAEKTTGIHGPSELSASEQKYESSGSDSPSGEADTDRPPDSPDDATAASASSKDAPDSREASAHRGLPPSHGLLSALMPPCVGSAHGGELGFEELLLTGLILLLSQSQRDSDIILMLALLLFYQ